MKHKRILLSAALLSVCTLASRPAMGQTNVALDPEFGARLSGTVDKKIARGLHLTFEGEARMDNNFQSFDRVQGTVGIRYKMFRGAKVGVAYALIAPYSTANSTFKNLRHRLMVDASYSYDIGVWRLSLKERFQATYRSGDMNEYQNPRTALTLKSRLKLQYRGLWAVVPYASVELRNTINAPAIAARYNATTDEYLPAEGVSSSEAGWFLDGFNSVYLNRVRGAVGVEWTLTRRSSVDLSLMADYVMDRVVDANSSGTILKSYTYEHGLVGWLAMGYTYKF